MVVILCLLSSITYFKFDTIYYNPLTYPTHKQSPIDNRANSKPTYEFNIHVGN